MKAACLFRVFSLLSALVLFVSAARFDFLHECHGHGVEEGLSYHAHDDCLVCHFHSDFNQVVEGSYTPCTLKIAAAWEMPFVLRSSAGAMDCREARGPPAIG